MKHETLGQINYWDKANNLSCALKFATAKKKSGFLNIFKYATEIIKLCMKN